jgi:hypothetical protein
LFDELPLFEINIHGIKTYNFAIQSWRRWRALGDGIFNQEYTKPIKYWQCW